MRLRVGQAVYIGYSQKASLCSACKPFVCNIGTITGGPFEPSLETMKWRSWTVACDGIGEAYVAEFLLSPFDDPDAAETRTHEVTERGSRVIDFEEALFGVDVHELGESAR